MADTCTATLTCYCATNSGAGLTNLSILMSNQAVNSSRARLIPIDGVINFRDLGGYKARYGQHVRWGRVFRSAQLDRLSEQGIQDLAALDIKVVIDLRFGDETSRYPTITAAVPNAEILAWQDEAQGDTQSQSDAIKRAWRDSLETKDPKQVREAMRVNYPKKLYSHQAIYRQMLLRLAKGQTPLMFHCAAGKDRTGVAAALILSLLGVDDEQIVEDYLITQEVSHLLVDAWHAGGATGAEDYKDFQNSLARYPQTLVQPVFDADETYIRTLLEYVNSTYQSFERYAKQVLEIDDETLAQLRANLLQD